MCILFLSLLQLKSGFSFDCTFLPVLVVSCLVTSPFVKHDISPSFAYFSEMS